MHSQKWGLDDTRRTCMQEAEEDQDDRSVTVLDVIDHLSSREPRKMLRYIGWVRPQLPPAC